jgi:hypothetical protein
MMEAVGTSETSSYFKTTCSVTSHKAVTFILERDHLTGLSKDGRIILVME